jgi:hypothetical protein
MRCLLRLAAERLAEASRKQAADVQPADQAQQAADAEQAPDAPQSGNENQAEEAEPVSGRQSGRGGPTSGRT